MATSIIDALIVTLGLDASGFKRGKAEADAALKETRNIAVTSAEDIVGGVAKMALGFTALFTAVRGVGDAIEYFKNLNHEISDLGYTSRQLGESAQSLRVYQQLAEGFGGSSKGITNTVSSLETAMFNMRQMGQMSSPLIAWQRFLGGLPPTNAEGGIDMIAAINQARQATAGLSSMEATQRMKASGLDEGTINAVLGKTKAVDDYIAAQQRSAAQIAADVDSAKSLQQASAQLQFDLAGVASVALKDATPSLEAMFKKMDDWVKSESILDTLNKLKAALDGINQALKDITSGNWMKGVEDLLPTSPGRFLMTGPLQMGWDWLSGKLGTDDASSEARRRASMAPFLSSLEKQYGLPAGILNQVATVESHYVPGIVNSAGAAGIFQEKLKYNPLAGQNNNNDAIYAAKMLSLYAKQFGGDWNKALAAFNVGPGALSDALSGKDPLGPEHAKATMAAAARYLKKISSAAGSSPTSSTRGPASLSIGNITINTQAKDANGIAADLAGAIRRKFNVFQTDAGLV